MAAEQEERTARTGAARGEAERLGNQLAYSPSSPKSATEGRRVGRGDLK